MAITRSPQKFVSTKPKPKPITTKSLSSAAAAKKTSVSETKAPATPEATKAPVSAQTAEAARLRAQNDVTAGLMESRIQGNVPAEAAAPALPPQTPESLTAIREKTFTNVYTPERPNAMEGVAAGEQVLSRGHKGDSVKETQSMLNKFGFNLAEDGKLGPRSEAAIRSFQKAAGLPESGQLDAGTLEKLKNGSPADIKPEIVTNVANVQSHSEIDGTATFERVSKTGQRNQMMSGSITVNGNTYQFNSGGHGRGNLPPGDYEIRRHLNSRGNRSMSRDGVGYSFAMSDKYDSRVGDTRGLLRIHPDGGSAGTEGCIGIVGNGATQAQFRADMNAEIARNGGTYNLRVG